MTADRTEVFANDALLERSYWRQRCRRARSMAVASFTNFRTVRGWLSNSPANSCSLTPYIGSATNWVQPRRVPSYKRGTPCLRRTSLHFHLASPRAITEAAARSLGGPCYRMSSVAPGKIFRMFARTLVDFQTTFSLNPPKNTRFAVYEPLSLNNEATRSN